MHRYRTTYRFFGILALLMLVMFTVSFFVARGRLQDAASTLSARKSARNAVAEEVSSLQDDFSYAQTDGYVECVARDELGLIYPGEYRYVGGQ